MEMINDSDRKIGTITIRHNGEELVWLATAYDHPTLIEPEGIFRDINNLWASFRPDHQNRIWEVYKEIHDILNSIVEVRRLRDRLIPLVKRLYDEHPYELADRWIKFHSKMVYPLTLTEEYTAQHPRELTYLRKDYQELATLSLLLRPMVPIWGVFLKIVKAIFNRNKERLAVILLTEAEVINTPPYRMLREHVERLKDKHLANNPVPLSTKATSDGTENIGESIFCLVVVRRVALGEISQKDPNINIISNVYKHVRSQFDSLDKSNGGRIGEKHKARGDETEDNVSRAEAYKAKTEVTPGSIATIQVFTEDLKQLARAVDPTLDMDKLKLCFASAKDAKKEGFYQCTPHQLLFCQYVLSNVISPRSLEYPNLDEMFNCLVVTQAVLWHWGFPQLAALVITTAYEQSEEEAMNPKKLPAVGKELRERLHKAYPYYPYTGSETRGRNDCVAITVMGNIVSMLRNTAWVPNAPLELIRDAAEATPPGRAMRFNAEDEIILPTDFNDLLASFFLKLTDR